MHPSSNDGRIRNASAAQVADMIRIADATNLSPWSAQNYLDEMKTATSIMLCLQNPSNTVTGFIVGRVVAGATIGAVDAEIYNVAVIEAEQRRGHGQSLLDAFLDQCSEREVQHIWLEVRESNVAAINFYLRNGFEHVQCRQNFYENPREHALLMRRKLK